MTITKDQKTPQPLRLDISNANLHITPEQFERLCIDNPDLQLELDGQVILMSPVAIDENHLVSKYYLEELSPEETARRVAIIERFRERESQEWNGLTPEEKANHDEQFESLYQSLEESRR